MTRFFEFAQQNSGGIWVRTADLDRFVVIEASDRAEALERAGALGLYFGEDYRDFDCACCGPRWAEPDECAAPRGAGASVVHYLDGRRGYLRRVEVEPTGVLRF
jgi:hypothetical protein